jgi:hypothetical protein
MAQHHDQVTASGQGNDRLRAALASIAELAKEAAASSEDAGSDEYETGGDSAPVSEADAPGCVIKSLPSRLLIKAAETARKISPVNAPVFGMMSAVGGEFNAAEPLRIAVLTSKYWGPAARTLTVSFMESVPANLKTRIIGHLNAWTRTAGISFVGTSGVGTIRISLAGSGYWSYLGTDVKLIPTNRPTMNLQGFTMNTPESEYKRVVRHECGHTLGFPHEHMRSALVARIDPNKAYKWFWETYGWDKATVDSQVLTPLSEASLMGTPVDQTSIMCYQLPGLITKDGKPITGGLDINQTDYGFAGRIYPRPGHAAAVQRATVTDEDDWPESEDVQSVDYV